MSTEAPALSLRGLAVGHDTEPVVKDIDLDIPAGQWWALVGPNGCGKTTLLETAAGKRPALAGEIRIAGCDLDAEPRSARSALGWVLSPAELPPRLTGRELLSLFTALHHRDAPAEAVIGLIEQWRFEPYLDTPVDRCSLGTRQKLGVLLALVGEPRLLLMDESFNGLDPASGLVLKSFLDEAVANARLSVLLATHALDLVERHADAAVLITRGRIRGRLGRDDLRTNRGRLDERLAELAEAAD